MLLSANSATGETPVPQPPTHHQPRRSA